MSKFKGSDKTWFQRRSEKRTAELTMLDTPWDDTKQSTYYEDGETCGQFEQEYLNPYGTAKKGEDNPETEVTAGGNS